MKISMFFYPLLLLCMIPIQQVEAENIPWDEVEKADEFLQKHEKCTLETVRIKGLRLHLAAQDNGKGYLLGRLKQAELEKLQQQFENCGVEGSLPASLNKRWIAKSVLSGLVLTSYGLAAQVVWENQKWGENWIIQDATVRYPGYLMGVYSLSTVVLSSAVYVAGIAVTKQRIRNLEIEKSEQYHNTVQEKKVVITKGIVQRYNECMDGELSPTVCKNLLEMNGRYHTLTEPQSRAIKNIEASRKSIRDGYDSCVQGESSVEECRKILERNQKYNVLTESATKDIQEAIRERRMEQAIVNGYDSCVQGESSVEECRKILERNQKYNVLRESATKDIQEAIRDWENTDDSEEYGVDTPTVQNPEGESKQSCPYPDESSCDIHRRLNELEELCSRPETTQEEQDAAFIDINTLYQKYRREYKSLNDELVPRHGEVVEYCTDKVGEE